MKRREFLASSCLASIALILNLKPGCTREQAKLLFEYIAFKAYYSARGYETAFKAYYSARGYETDTEFVRGVMQFCIDERIECRFLAQDNPLKKLLHGTYLFRIRFKDGWKYVDVVCLDNKITVSTENFGVVLLWED